MKSKPPNEAAIRDTLAARLDLIEPGLILVDTEFHLRNNHGASAFLDIYARAQNGQRVIIEIKRTNAAAREAVQELVKYAPLLRERFLLKETDYRLIILSVEWHELLVPYSEFAKHAPYELSAGKIMLGDDGLPVRVDPITLPALVGARRISRRHFMWRFVDPAAASHAVPLIAKHMQAAGLEDFVLIRSQSNNPEIREKGFVYFAQQQLSLAGYMELLETQVSKDRIIEYKEYLAELTEEEDRVAEAADEVWMTGCGELYRAIGGDHGEISNPEKARRWFADDAQRDVIIERFGRFADAGIDDATILTEIVGHGGESDFLLDLRANTDSRPQIEAMRAAVENIFFFNPAWRGMARDLIDYACRKSQADLHILAFSNEDILRGIAGLAFGYPAFMATFRIDIESKGEIEQFMGVIDWDGRTPDFDKIIADYFDGNAFNYFMMVHFGSNRSLNVDIMDDLGLRYAVWREGENGPERIRVQGATISASPRPPIGGVPGLINANVDEIHKIVALFMEHDYGFAKSIEAYLNSDIMKAEDELEALVATVNSPARTLYWTQTIKGCDVCDRPFALARYMVDAHLKRGVGANVCALCFKEHGVGFGTGRGQVYEAKEEGWLHVAG
ncbi:endonuclease NucS domain-containing protein [uncultured Parasphingorhabdus sp.]|uniref:endonuclease NucS domain-containing protein n=1 Tax=uncultured Parasphingorhabdus sp. TaxID=2709694 RepID=UPI0030D8D6C0|tara:strand:- start:21885 stop:23741 length:1857 start_codon:yes stop_codon:yes gene_type:complete